MLDLGVEQSPATVLIQLSSNKLPIYAIFLHYFIVLVVCGTEISMNLISNEMGLTRGISQGSGLA